MFRSRRFYSYFFSYMFLVVILLVAVSGVVYQSFFHTLRGEAERNTIATLTQFRDTIDQRLLEMDKIALDINANTNLTPYAVQEEGFNAFKAVSELKKYAATNLFLNDILLYYTQNEGNRLYSAGGTYDLSSFFNEIYRYEYWGLGDFLSLLPDMRAPVMRPAETIRFSQERAERYSTYLYPIPVHAGKPFGVILFLIEERAFETIARNILKDYSGMLYVLNDRREVVYRFVKEESAETADWAADALRASRERPGVEELERNGQVYTVVNLLSDKNGWSYATVMPNAKFAEKVNRSRGLFNLAVAAVFMLGVAIAVVFSLQHYKPLQRLMGLALRHQEAGAPKGRTNEIAFISEALGRMAEEKDGMLKQMRSQANAVREQLLLSLIKGTTKNRSELIETLRFAGLRMEHPYFVVMLFLIDDYDKFKEQHSEAMREILKYSLIKVFEELSEEAGDGYGVELLDKRGVAFLLNVREGFQDDDDLRELAVKGKTFFKQYFRTTVTVGIGRSYSRMSGIAKSYDESCQAADYRFLKGGDSVIGFAETETRVQEERIPPEFTERLLRGIRQGEADEAEAAVKEGLRLVKERRVSLETARYMCFDLVNAVLRTLHELDIPLDDRLRLALERLAVSRYETVEELERFVVDACRGVCRFVDGKKESKNVALLESMKRYVEEHYADNAISLDRIAEHCGLSASYATRFFKDQTGVPLIRYVDRLRMDHAKKLLKTTERLLSDITSEIGYADATNFIRKFKKAEGMTPMEYRAPTQANAPIRTKSSGE